MAMASVTNNAKTPRRNINNENNTNGTDPLQVYLRIRPMEGPSEVACIQAISETTIHLTPPDNLQSGRCFNNKETQYEFRKIFNIDSKQTDIYNQIAHPLVENVLQGKNGLLMAYGVTGSGKTFTMNGSLKDPGVMTRSIDVIFNSISKYLAPKYTFKPDKLNGFEIMSTEDILLLTQAEINNGILNKKQNSWEKTPGGDLKRNKSDPEIERRLKDKTTVTNLDEDNGYGVFISYIEIYNNSVFDLLENIPESKIISEKNLIKLNNRILREDGDKNMYIHGVNEIEVRTPEEAFAAYYKGQNRKRMAKTDCNDQSSRSHSVFIIRIVQAPLDDKGEQVVQDKRALVVSQLSLVDLAGSERNNRTGVTSGLRLREAGNINNSLLTLRTCLEYLKENQQNGQKRNPPYRESKLTHLFKSYFTGDGCVRMIVCVNPRYEDYDENLAVLKFAESTQEIQILRPDARKFLDFNFTPGRRKFNEMSKKMKEVINEEVEAAPLPPIDSGILYSFGPAFPPFDLETPHDAEIFKTMLVFLENRLKKEKELQQDIRKRARAFRDSLCEIDSKVQKFGPEKEALLNRTKAAEKKAHDSDNMVQTLNLELESANRAMQAMKRELDGKDMLVNKYKMEKEKSQDKIKVRDRMSHKLQHKLKEQAESYEVELRNRDKVLSKVKTMLDSQPLISSSCSSSGASTPRSGSRPPRDTPAAEIMSAKKENMQPPVTPYRRPGGIAVSNPRRRRSRSAGPAGGKEWLHHQPLHTVETGTVFQPTLRNNKSVNKLTDVKDIAKTSKYSLLTQDQNTDGELETHLFKADVLPTVGGGAQVVFNDVETLKQSSPTNSPVRKRIALLNAQNIHDVQSKCSVALEGHTSTRSRSRSRK